MPGLENSSFITAPDEEGSSNVAEVLGLIGPIHMKCSNVMPSMEVTTTLMKNTLIKIRQDLH